MELPWGALLAAGNSVGVVSLVVWFFRDRRKDQVSARVAEKTERFQVDLTSVSAAEAHLALVNKAFDSERASLLRRIQELERLLGASEDRVVELQRKVAVLQDRVDELQGTVRALQRELSDVARDLDEAAKKQDPRPEK